VISLIGSPLILQGTCELSNRCSYIAYDHLPVLHVADKTAMIKQGLIRLQMEVHKNDPHLSTFPHPSIICAEAVLQTLLHAYQRACMEVLGEAHLVIGREGALDAILSNGDCAYAAP